MKLGPLESTDEEIFARVARGDRAAFAHLVARHRARATGLAARMTGDRASADDVAQEAFIRAWRAAPAWVPPAEGGPARFTTWFTRIVINLAIDRLRARPHARLDGVPEPADGRADAETAMIAREQEALLARAVASLPERQRAAVALTYDQGLGNAEAAAVLQTSTGAFELLLVRARRTLRQAVQERLKP